MPGPREWPTLLFDMRRFDMRRFDMRRGEGRVMVLVLVGRSHPRQAEMEEK
jgi:hypothetical protein